MKYLKELLNLFFIGKKPINRVNFILSIILLSLININFYNYFGRTGLIIIIFTIVALFNLCVKRIADTEKQTKIKVNIFFFNVAYDYIIEIIWNIARMFYVKSMNPVESKNNTLFFITIMLILINLIAITI